MMPTTNVVFVTDFKSTYDLFRDLDYKLSPPGLSVFLATEVVPYIIERTERRFTNEGDDVVGKWMELSMATQNIRAHLGYGPAHPINIRTHDLENFVTGISIGTQIREEVIGASLEHPGPPPTQDIEDALRQAQFGDTQTLSGQVSPARPVIGLNEADMAFVLTLLARYVTEGRTAEVT